MQQPTVGPKARKEYARQVLTNLAADPPVSPFVKGERVEDTDSREELRGSQGCRAHKGTFMCCLMVGEGGREL